MFFIIIYLTVALPYNSPDKHLLTLYTIYTYEQKISYHCPINENPKKKNNESHKQNQFKPNSINCCNKKGFKKNQLKNVNVPLKLQTKKMSIKYKIFFVV